MGTKLRNLLYGALMLLCMAFGAFIFINGSQKANYPQLQERSGALAKEQEWINVQNRVDKLFEKLKDKPKDTRTLLLLAKEYIQEGHTTGNASYYNKSALEFIDAALAAEPRNLDAICYKSMVYLSQHRFEEGREVAMKGLSLNPYNSFIYGLLVDANVELGDYDKAVEMSDKMNSIRPDLRSYSRVSYLREIYGDVPGAIEAMEMAVNAGMPGADDTAWSRMVLGHLFEDSNQPEAAMEQYQLALAEKPNYPFALAGVGRMLRYKKDYPTAIKYMEGAKAIMSDGTFFEELIDLYRLNNEPRQSETLLNNTLNALLADNITANKNKNEGHYSDREIAMLYLKKGDWEKALTHARAEYERRPQNIDAAETYAWALYKNGNLKAAAPLLPTVMRTGSKNPERLVRMGLVYFANGETDKGESMIKEGLAAKPYMDETLVEEALKHIRS